jgi:hypothetical protein
MRKPIPQILAGLLSLAVLLPAVAQELQDNVTEVPEIRRYAVEVIVFRYAQDVSAGSEVFIPDEIAEEPLLGELVFEDELEDLAVRDAEPEDEPEPRPDTEFVLMAEDDYQLDEVMEHLRRIDAYEPLMHFGWTQATWPEEETDAIPLRRFAEPPEGVDGNLTLYLSRYLHLVVDLQLDAPPTAEVLSRDDMTAGGEFLGYAEGEQQVLPVRYSIQENRILKNGELRYFDHPKFGVLALVIRIEDEDGDLDDGGELLGYGPE